MRKSEQYEMGLAAEEALQKALETYEELCSELERAEEKIKTDLLLTIHDSIRNLSRKVEAYLHEKISMEKVVDEFVFEYQVLDGELEVAANESVRTKKFARRLLSSFEDFIIKVGGKRKLAVIKEKEASVEDKKSKGKAYLFWFLGFFGILGFHRFYLGRIGTGIGWLLTGGLFGVGALYDLFALSNMVEEQNVYNELKAAKIKQLKEGKN